MHHELKILPTHFEAVIRGVKKFEIRDNSDRGYQAGDTALLREYREYEDGTPLYGRSQMIEISYVSNYNQPKNQVVFAFSLCGDPITTGEPNAALMGGEAVPLESTVRGDNPGKDEQ